MEDFRHLLKNGVFGEMSNGNRFVVVNDLIVYAEGGFDRVTNIKPDLSFNHYRVMRLVTGNAFGCVEVPVRIIFDRTTGKVEIELTIEEIEERLGITNLKIIGGNN